ncbi:tyrosine--tRNA ligase [Candidatus Saccharibacteria bacterium]|nr:tyrosine--tRNA ligase [Candidatus Saccharibacteria bacterium]
MASTKEGVTVTLSEELTWRGFVNQTTFDDITALDGDSRKFYFGVDPSGHGMQIGNLATAMMLRHLMARGHQAYLLVGGATGMIGDPDGKLDERNLNAVEEIAGNKAEIERQYRQVFSGQLFEVVDNYDWFKNINYLSFLREVGKHVPMSMMLGREFIQARLGEGGNGISYAEFSYSLIQGYDFLHLYREHGVTLQVCGADQWGNSIAGVDMIRRIEGGEAHVLSAPLIINKATGRKFGKTEGGTIWLDPELTSVFKFYQFWLNVDDEGVIDYMKVYTLLSKNEVETIASEHAAAPERRSAQRRLAWEITKIVHGEDRAHAAEQATRVLFGGEAFNPSDEGVVSILKTEIPVVGLNQFVTDILQAAEIVKSKGEARRLISGGAISINGLKIAEDINVEEVSLIKKGKNTFILVN